MKKEVATTKVRKMKSDLRFVILLGIVSIGLGWVSVKLDVGEVAEAKVFKVSEVGEVLAVLSDSSVLMIDARTSAKYSKSHIPGAINIAPENFQDQTKKFAKRLSTASRAIVYCDGTVCSLSQTIATQVSDSYPNLQITLFQAGWARWVWNKLPIEAGDMATSK